MPAQRRPLPHSLLDHEELSAGGTLRLLGEAVTTGLLTGLVIGCLRIAYTHSNSFLASLYAATEFSLLKAGIALLFVAACALVAWLCVRIEPLSGGSGIPQVELALRGLLPMPWLRIVCCKFVGTLASMCGCLSLGRAAPSIQMGAAIGCGVGQLWQDNGLRPRFLNGGAVAGLTACFGAPLAGICFAFEELRTSASLPQLLFMSLAAASAWATTAYILNLGLVFPLNIAAPDWLSPAELCLIPGISLVSALLCRLYLDGIRLFSGIGDRYLTQPVRYALIFATGFALLMVFSDVIDGFAPSVQNLAETAYPVRFILVLWLAKFLFNIASGASYAPGGLIMPLLFAGALTGCLMSSLLGLLHYPASSQLLIPLGMAAFFSGIIRAPFTAAFLIAETTACWNIFPALLAASIMTFAITNALGAQPLFTFMRMRQLRLMRQSQRRADVQKRA